MMAEAVVLPGGSTGPKIPLLHYAGEVAARRGATVHRHEWAGRPPMPWGPHLEGWVCDEAVKVLHAVGGRPLLIGKSLGSLAAPVAAERVLPAVWLTPLLTEPWVAPAMSRAIAPILLVGGTADRWWDGALARSLTPHVLEVEGADHNMDVPGPLTDSIAVLARVAVAMEQFLDKIEWPG
jgi:hypothetical protein